MSHRWLVLAGCALGLFSAGCGKTITLRGPITPSVAEEVTRAASGKRVQLTLLSDKDPLTPEKRVGRGLVTSQGALSFQNEAEAPHPLTAVPFKQVRVIEFNDPKKGAAMGAVVGLLPGFLLGVMAGSVGSLKMGCSYTNGQPHDCPSEDPSMALTLGVALGAGVVGALIGAAKGDRTTYIFSEP